MTKIDFKRLPAITIRDIEKLLGINNIYSHCKFCREAKNDSYCNIKITNEAIEELKEEIKFGSEAFWKDQKEIDRLTMDLILSKKLKEIFPYDDEVLVWISW